MKGAPLVVAGAGPVGLAFAAACAETCQVVERGEPRPAQDAEETDFRVFALSDGTRRFLASIGAWERLPASRLAPVRAFEVFGDDGGKLHFPPARGEPAAWIVESNRLARATEEAARARNVALTFGRGIATVRPLARGAEIVLEDGQTMDASLLVGADGPASAVRDLLGLSANRVPFGQTAVVSHFHCERPHGDVARQWFLKEGVLAWLPLTDERISMVWSAPDALATTLLALDGQALAERVRDAGGAVLGDLAPASVVRGFPLQRLNVPRIAMPGAILIGDAAHGVHPLAGQGLNLGFQDARSLAATLASRSPLERAGDLAVLRRHERARRADVGAMQFVTSQLNGLFEAPQPLIRRARNAGLDLLDRLSPLRDRLASRAVR